MNLELIKQIVNQENVQDFIKEVQLIDALAAEDEVITNLLKIVQRQLYVKNKLIPELNFNLARSKYFLETRIPKTKGKAKPGLTREFVIEETEKFYKKNKDIIKPNFL